MKVLHLFDPDNQLIAQHVAMLQEPTAPTPSPGTPVSGKPSADGPSAADAPAPAIHPDIVHVHGCWNRTIAQQAERLSRQGARIVLTPHGALQPWIISHQRPVEKTTQSALWQRRLVQHAYAVIAHGRMEYDGLSKLSWNPRVELIRNAVTSNTITPEAMRRQTNAVYQKVMDSYTLPLLTADDVSLLALILKAGITGDKRWVAANVNALPGGTAPADSTMPDATGWRRLLLYADHENIRPVVDRGISVLQLDAPAIDTAAISAYLPSNYTKPVPLTTADPVAVVQQTMNEPLCLLRLVELDRTLRQPAVNDDSLADELSDQSMTRYFQRLLQLLAEQTLIDEGFMPLPPVDDRLTQQMRKQLTTHLKIV
jgi:hypothetical protein